MMYIIFTEQICSTCFSGSDQTIPDSFFAGTKPYWIGLLFTHSSGDLRAISKTERGFATRTGSLKWRVTYRIGVHTKYRSAFRVGTVIYPV